MPDVTLYIETHHRAAFRKAAEEIGQWLRADILANGRRTTHVHIDGWVGIGKSRLIRRLASTLLGGKNLPPRNTVYAASGTVNKRSFHALFIDRIIASGFSIKDALRARTEDYRIVFTEHPEPQEICTLHIAVGFERYTEETQRASGRSPSHPITEKARGLVLTVPHGNMALRPLLKQLQAAGITARFV